MTSPTSAARENRALITAPKTLRRPQGLPAPTPGSLEIRLSLSLPRF